MNKKQKKNLRKIIIGAVLFAAALAGAAAGVPEKLAELFGLSAGLITFIMFLIPYAFIGWDVLFKSFRNICHGQVFDENFLMGIATIGAFCIKEYHEAAVVMLFFKVGEFFENYAVGKSRKSIADIMEIRPDYVNVESADGLVQKDPEEISVGDVIVVKPGEKIPLDGIVIDGSSQLNTVALTGESVPREVFAGDSVISGCVNMNGVLKVKVTKQYQDSTVAKILALVENSSLHKAKAENFITKFAMYYTPAVVFAALIIAIVPPLVIGGNVWSAWIHRALSFLVISCPCALVISVPLSFFGGIGGASKCGILIKGAQYLEALSNCKTVVFDKTGTLTKGNFKVTSVVAADVVTADENKILELAAYAEYYSNHPLASSIKEAYGKEIDKNRISQNEEIAGHGIKTVIDGTEIFVGNGKLMDKIGVEYNQSDEYGTIVHIATADIYYGYIVISDEIKDESMPLISGLKALGVSKTVMLTGDRSNVGEYVAKTVGVDEVRAELLPENKVTCVEELLSIKDKNETLAFVGDGINDAPVLIRADIGIAMGAMGSDAAIEAADIVLMDDNPLKINTAIEISRKTKKIVMQNIVFALSVKLIILIMSAFGLVGMWAAVFADVGVSVIAILNAMRTLVQGRK